MTDRLSGVSRSCAADRISSGQIRVDDKIRKPSFRISAGMTITGAIARNPTGNPFLPEPVDFGILHEDPTFIVINKPSGLVVHPGSGNLSATLANGLIHRYPELKNVGADTIRPGIVHRLDKDTSGVMVIARTPAAYDNLAHQFAERLLHKTYTAFVYGEVKQESGRMEIPIFRHPVFRKKMAAHPNGRPAKTLWRVISRFTVITKMEFVIMTGRTHQIRVHCAAMHHPVVGDCLYGFKRPEKAFSLHGALLEAIRKVDRQMLHAQSIEFLHPATGERVSFSAPVPEDMLAFEAELKA
ncbi:MAG: RluA family pseudouridine synthase [Deltaproteobacteria bacterium]|nr:RluA family pseudouridine synthase [Deltaproteobacteria bacterium]